MRSMRGSDRFQTTYLALIVLAWEALERIDTRLDCLHEPAETQLLQSQLQLLRLELLQLGEKAGRCAGSRHFSVSQNVVVNSVLTGQ